MNSDGSPKTLVAAPSVPGRTLVLDHDDFGPQSMVHELLGFGWYAWSTPGCFEQDDRFDVRVVVYRGDRAAIARAYPTVRLRSDYRLLERDAALRFLAAEIAGLADERDGILAELRGRLIMTRARIAVALR